MMEVASPLADLPDQLAAIGASIAAGGQAIDQASMAMVEDRVLLRRASVQLRLCFANQDAHRMLFFFRTGGETFVPVDATVSFRAAPDANGLSREAVASPRSVRLPPFLAEPSDDDVTRYGPPGATRDNTIFVSMGDDVLAIKDAERPSRASARYSPGRVPGVVETRRFRLRPFLQLLFTLRDWVSNGGSAGVRVACSATEDSALQRILDSLIDGYARTVAALGNYRLSAFTSTVRMRLDEHGEVAQRTSDEAFQLAVRLDAGEWGAEVLVAPPDLVASGPLLDAFLDQLAYDPPARKAISRMLGCFEVQVPAFIDSARDGAIAMRVGREGGRDRELLWLPGTDRSLLVTAVFDVDLRAEPRVTLHDADDVEALPDPVDASGVAHLFRLIAGIRLWVNLLR